MEEGKVMPKELFGQLWVSIIIAQYECESLSAQQMKDIIELKLISAKKDIYHNLGLDDGTYELSQDIK